MPNEVPVINALGELWEARVATGVAAAAMTSTTDPKGKFVLGDRSLAELEPVHPKLKQCVELAIGFSSVDFRVNQGLRTVEEQKKAVAEGHSRTMNSKHLRQADGFVWAVDLVVMTNGAVDWTFNKYGAVAFAMDKAATQLGIAGHVRWGCAWDRVLSDFGGDESSYLAEAKAYSLRHTGSDLLDAPHFEWVP
jgi:peptidoglycan L-alanyl-D-glutamate endopeptidase CwlK